MFWDNLKAKGKLRLGAILVLCAVFLGCTILAFSELFGKSIGSDNLIIAEAATSGDIGSGNVVLSEAEQKAKNEADGTKNKPYIITSAADWTELVMAARTKGVETTVYAKLAANWTAKGGSFGAGNGFGIKYTVDGTGCLLVPEGANISLDLAGHNIDRHLTAAVANGTVIYVAGTFELTDSSTEDTALQGKVTGGFNSTNFRGAGITVWETGIFKFSGGNIYANRAAEGNTVGGGIYLNNGKLYFDGGRVENNVSVSVGGVYSAYDSVTYLSGGIITGNVGGTNGNTGGGMRVTQLYLSGSLVISNNIAGATVDNGEAVSGTGYDSDIQFTTVANAKIIIESALDDDTHIGIGAGGRSLPFTFTSGYGEHNGEGSSSHFFPNMKGQSIGVTEIGGKRELTIAKAYDQNSWAEAVAYSIANNVSVKVSLSKDWTATDGSFGTGFGFGTTYSESDSGAIFVPKGADMVIDLQGYNIDRGLQRFTNNGMVIYCLGKLEITDSSTKDTEEQGKVTGGFSIGESTAGGILLGTGAKVTLSGGNIYGNKALTGSGAQAAGGVTCGDNAYFTMTGGRIENNFSDSVGGAHIWNSSNGATLSGGVITGNVGGTRSTSGGGIRAVRLYLSGSPQLYNNINGATIDTNTCAVTPDTGYSNDTRFTSSPQAKFVIVGKLENAYMGVMRSSQGIDYVFTQDYGKYNSDSPSNYFFSNEAETGIEAVGTGTAMEAKFVAAATSGATAAEIAKAWSNAINESLTSKKQVYFKLAANWTATSGSFGTGVGFGTFEIDNIDESNGTASNGAGHLAVPTGANIVLDLNGNTIDRELTAVTSSGHVIYVHGELEITDTSPNRDGKITGGYSSRQGGGVAVVDGGTLRLTAGNITQNTAYSGGGVLANSTAKFYMTGGKITDNTATIAGSPAIYIRGSKSTFYMSGGEISGNVFDGTGGQTAAVSVIGKAYISGGTIINNYSGSVKTGIYGGLAPAELNGNKGTIYISGNPVIKENGPYDKSVECNVYLANGYYLVSDGTMKSGAEVGITVTGTVADDAQITFTSGFSDYNTTSPLLYFFADNKSYEVGAQVNVTNDVLEGCIATQAYTYLSAKPQAVSSVGSKEYDGYTIELVTGVNLGYMSLTGTTTATDVGTYETIVTPAVGCYWPDGTNDPITVKCTISARNITNLAADVFVIKLKSGVTYTYNGSAILPTIESVTDTGVNSIYQVLTSVDHYNIVNANNTNASTSATVTLKGKGNYTGTKTITFTISPADITATIKNVSETYTGNEFVVAKTGTSVSGTQTLIGLTATTKGSQVYTFKFSTTITNGASGNWTSAAESFKITNVNASATTVYYQITAPNHNALYGQFTVKINNATITGTVANQSWTYDGKTHQIINNALNVTNNNYTKNGITLTTVNNQTQTWKFSLSAVSDWGSVQADNNLTFLNVAEGNNVTVYYQVTAPNHSAKTGSFTVTISKATLTDASSEYSGTYDGAAHGITVSATGFKGSDTWENALGKAIKYGTASGSYTLTTNPTETNVISNKTIYYQITFDNYNTITGSKTITIKAFNISGEAAVGSGSTVTAPDDVTYTGETQEKAPKSIKVGLKTAGDTTLKATDYNLKYTAAINVGTVTITIEGKGNYTGSTTTTYTINKADLTDTSTDYSGTYDGTAHGITVSATGFKGSDTWENALGKAIKYGTASGSYTLTTNPTETNVISNKTIYYQITFDNYNTITGSKTITIKAFDISGTAQVGSGSTVTAPDDVTYTGETQEKAPKSIKVGLKAVDDTTLEATDYNLTYTAAIDVGTVTITIEGTGNYTGSTTTTYQITNATITGTVEDQSWEYDGKTHQVINNDLSVTNNNYTKIGVTLTTVNGQTQTWKFSLSAVSDWGTVQANNNLTFLNVADGNNVTVYYQVTAPNHSAITGSFTVTISKATLTDASAAYNETYDGQAHGITVSATGFKGSDTWENAFGKAIKYGTASGSYTLTTNPTETNVINNKTIYYQITFDNYNTITGSKTITIKAFNISGEAAVGSGSAVTNPGNVTYNGESQELDPTVKVGLVSAGDTKLALGSDYTLKYSNSVGGAGNAINAGTITVTITGTGNYTGTTQATYTINKADLTDTSTDYSGTYDGTAHGITVSATGFKGSDTWENALGKTVTYGTTSGTYNTSENPTETNVISNKTIYYKITFTNYNDITGSKTITIKAFDISGTAQVGSGSTVTAPDDVTYTGETQEEAPKSIKVGLKAVDDTTLEATDYNLSYTAAINVGTVTITIEGKGNYTGSTTTTYQITNAAITGTVEDQSWTYDGKTHQIINNALSVTNNNYTKNGITLTTVNNQTQTWKFSLSDLSDWSSVNADNNLTFLNVADGNNVTVYYQVTAPNHSAKTGSFTVTISKATLEDASSECSVVYDGDEHNITVSATGFKGNDTWGNALGKTILYGTEANSVNSSAEIVKVDVTNITVYYEITFGNYNTITGSKKLEITTRTITGITNVSFEDKTYDGTRKATLNGNNIDATYDGIVEGETLTILSADVIEFETANWGSHNVTATQITLGDGSGKASNYSIAPTVTATGTATINQFNLAGAATVGEGATVNNPGDVYYTGKSQELDPTVWVGLLSASDTKLVFGTDYTLTYSNSNSDGDEDTINAGTITVTITGMGNYTGTATVKATYEIKKAVISSVEWDKLSYGYDGDEHKPVIKEITTDNNSELADDAIDLSSMFEYAYTPTKDGDSACKAAGDYKVTAALSNGFERNFEFSSSLADGNTGSTSKAFKIALAGITLAEIAACSFVYDRKGHTHAAFGKAESATTIDGSPVKWYYATGNYGSWEEVPLESWSDDISTVTFTNANTYTVFYKVTADNYEDNGGYTTIKINTKDVKDAELVSELSSVVYTGNAVTSKSDFDIQIKFDGYHTLDADSEYGIVFEDNIKVGTAKIIVTGKGNYSGTKEFTFEITPATIGGVDASGYEGTYDGDAHDAMTDKTATPVNGSDDEQNTATWYYFWDEENSFDGDWNSVGSWSEANVMPQFTNAGEYTVFYKVTAPNHNDAGGRVTVKIDQKDIGGSILNDGKPLNDKTYTGETVDYDDFMVQQQLKSRLEELVADRDYYITYYRSEGTADDRVNVGEITVVVNGKGNYTGTKEITFNIIPADGIKVSTEKISGYSKVYDGRYHASVEFVPGDPAASTTNGNAVLWWYSDTQLAAGDSGWSQSVPQVRDVADSGTYYWMVTADNNNPVLGSVEVVITPVRVTSVSDIAADGKVYDGSEYYLTDSVKPDNGGEAKVHLDDAVIDGYVQEVEELNSDSRQGDLYITWAEGLTYTDMGKFGGVDKGTYNVTIPYTSLVLGGEDADNYELALSSDIVIQNVEISARIVKIQWSDTELEWNGNAQKPSATITNLVDRDKGKTISPVIEITQYGTKVDAKAPGEYNAKITGLNGDSDVINNYTIEGADYDDLNQLFTIFTTNTIVYVDTSDLVYDGSAKKPKIYYNVSGSEVEIGQEQLKDGTTIEIKYADGTPVGEDGAINAGNYTITLTLNENYIWWDDLDGSGSKTKTISFTIDKATIEGVKLESSKGNVYNGNAYELTVDWSAATMNGAPCTNMPDGITVTLYYDGVASNGVTKVGNYKVTAKFTVNDNYYAIADIVDVELEIIKADVNLTDVAFESDNKQVDYTGDKFKNELNGTWDDDQISVTITYEKDGIIYGADGVSEVGEYTVKATFAFKNAADKDNYRLLINGAETFELTAKLTVNKQKVDLSGVVFENKEEEYDGNVHRILVSGSAVGIEGVTYTYEYATDAGFSDIISTDGVKDAGSYWVRVTFTVADNYSSDEVLTKTAKLTITPAKLTVKADDKTIIYGDDPNAIAFTATFKGLASGDTAAMLGTLTFKLVGYSIYGDADIYENAIEVSGLSTTNYTVTYEKGDLIVKPREIQIRWWNDASMQKQDLTYNYSGDTFLPYAEVINAVNNETVKVTVEGGRSEVGMNYEAKVTDIDNPNYTLPTVGLTVNFDILPYNPKAGVVFWDYTTLYYNGKEQKPKAYYFENETDNVPKELTVTVDRKSVNAGNYTAKTVLNGVTYTQEFKIEKRTVYIVIGDFTTGYTGGTPDLSDVEWTYAEGSLEFVAGENYKITFSCPAITDKGTYPIIATFTCSNGDNYIVEFSGSWYKAGDTENNGKCGTLTVTSVEYDMSKVTFTGTEVTYDGEIHVVGVMGLPEGVTVASMDYQLEGWSLGGDGVINAGVYRVIVTFTGNPNFEPIANMEVTLIIKKAALTVKANDSEITYGDSVTTNGATYTINGVEYEADSDKLNGQLGGALIITVEDGYAGNAGKYKLIPAGLQSDNYEINFVPGTLTVLPREITVTWYSDSTTSSTNLNYDYDGLTHEPFPVASGMLGNDVVTFVVSGGTKEAGLNFTATIVSVSNSNYVVNEKYASVKFNVIQKGVVIWDNQPLIYNGQNQAPKAYYFDEEEQTLKELTVKVREEQYSKAGTYHAYVPSESVPHGINAGDDYTYEILPQSVTLEIEGASLTYGDVDGKLAGALQSIIDALREKYEGEYDIDFSRITLTCNVNNSSAVGTYVIIAVCEDGNYTVTFVIGALEIVKAPVDTSVLDAFFEDHKNVEFDYNGQAHSFEIDVDLPDGVTGVTYKYYFGGKEIDASQVVDAGEYLLKVYFTVDGNHEEITAEYTVTITINKAELDVKFAESVYEFTYDGKTHTVQVTGNLTGVKQVTYEYATDKDFVYTVGSDGVKNAGDYWVRAIIVLENDNYVASTLEPVQLKIKRAALTVTANDATIVYGETPEESGYGYTAAGLASEDAGDLDTILGNIVYEFESITKVGVYVITITGNSQSDNYDITYKTGKLTVTPYVLTEDNVKWYDAKDGNPLEGDKFVYTYKAGTIQQPYAVAVLSNGETIVLVVEGGQINAGYGYEAKIVRIEGEYAANYMLPAEGLKVVFDIIPAPKAGTIIWDNTPLYYDGSNLKPKAYYFLEEGGERFELTVTVIGDSKNVGKYTATVSLTGIEVELSGDMSKEFYVLARPVYIVIGDMTVEYGETPDMNAVNWQYLYPEDASKQFVSGEAFTITFNCGQIKGVGTYPISAQFISDNAENYEVIFTGNWSSAKAEENKKFGILTVIKASYDMSKVTVVGTEVTFDGKNHTVTVIGLPEGVEIESITYVKDGFSYGAEGVKNAGTYDVTVKFKGDANYGDLDDISATLTIKKAALTIKANNNTIVYGDKPSANGVTYTGFAKDEDGNEINDLMGALSYTYSYVLGGKVGEYDIIPAGFTSENYEIFYKVGTLTVTPRTITITWYDDETLSSATFTYAYDEKFHAPYAVAGNLFEGDSLELEVLGATDLPGFNFQATVAELTNPNYKLPEDGTTIQKFSIMPAPARSIIWDNAPIYYNGENRKPDAYYVEEDGTWTKIPDVRVYVNGVAQSEYKNVGLYTATVVYKGATSSQAYEILPIAVTVRIGNAEVEYGKAVSLGSLGWEYEQGSNRFIEADGAPISFLCPTYSVGSTVGEYEIIGSCSNGNYTVTFINGTLTVKKASYKDAIDSLIIGNLTATYDGKYHTISIDGLPEGVTATVTYEKDGKIYGANGVRDAGIYNVTISFTISDTVNYEPIPDMKGEDLILTIHKAKADLSDVIFNGTTKTVTYNGEVQIMLVSGKAIGVTGVTYTYYDASGKVEVVGGAINAGTYQVKAEFEFDPNYDGSGISALWATLVINKAELTVTADDGSVIYGEEADPDGYGYTVTGLAEVDSEQDVIGTVTFTYGVYGNAATYEGAIEIHGKETAENYNITYVYGTLTVTPREITIKWYDHEGGTEYTDDQVIEYEYEEGTQFIPFAKAEGLKVGDSLTLVVKIEREDAGDNYVATVQPLTNGNYALPVNVTIKFTIKYSDDDAQDHEFELVWDNDALYYNKAAQAPSARYFDGDGWKSVSEAGLVLEIKDEAGNVIEQAVNVGTYTAEYIDETGTFKNLKFEFTILPRNVYIVIGDMQIKFGETPDMSKVSWTYLYDDDDKNQFISGDSYTLTFSVPEITAAGKYPITGHFAGNDNYNVIFIEGSWATSGADNGAYGTLTVNKANYDMSKVTFSGTYVVYDGEVHQITVNGLPEGVTVTVTYMRNNWLYDGGVVNAGTYDVTVSFKGDDNHEPIADMITTITVRKADLTVTANDSSIIYGDAPAAAGVKYEGLAARDVDGNGQPNADVFEGSLIFEYNYVKGGNVGNYTVTPKGLISENYSITYVSGTLTVNKRTITVIWYNDDRMNSQTLRYNVDGNEHLPYAEAGNLVAGDRVELTVSGAQTEPGINYVATIVAISNSNYQLPKDGATVFFEIMPEAYVIVWESTRFVYNGEEQVPKAYYYTPNGERVSLNVTVKEGKAVYPNTYHAVASLISGNVPLDYTNAEYEFTIERREITIIVKDVSTVYGEGVVLTDWWEYAEGSAHFVDGAPIYPVYNADKTLPVGTYVISGRCSDTANYNVTFIDGTYTIKKAVVSAPEILSKEYTGELLQADVFDTDQYEVIFNQGGINAGVYTVILLLKDYGNYTWADTGSMQYYLEFLIVQATNEWVEQFEVRGSVTAGSGEMSITSPKAKFGDDGDIVIKYYSDENCTREVTEDYIKNDAPFGTYYAKVTLAGNDNYTGLESVYSFSVTGNLTVKIYWANTTLTYNGLEQAPQAYVWIAGEQVFLIVEGAQIGAGEHEAVTNLQPVDDSIDLSGYDFEGLETITFTIKARNITVYIEDASSVYGLATSDLGRLDWSIIQGSVLRNDELGISFTCEVYEYEFANAGKYAIIGHWTNTNYDVEFRGSWDGDDEYNGHAATYTVRKANITVSKSESTWFDEDGVIDRYQNYFVNLDKTDDDGNYQYITLKGGQKAIIYYGANLERYDAKIHDNLTDSQIAQILGGGVSTFAPEIKQAGNWVIYYRIEAENHEVKYGVWKVLIQPKDRYIIVNFLKPYVATYGESLVDASGNPIDILGELIDGGYISVEGAVQYLDELKEIAYAYAYEDVSDNGYVNGGTTTGKYSIRLVLNERAAAMEEYGYLEFKYSNTNEPNSDTNFDKYIVAPRPITFEWKDNEFVYDGQIHLPAAKITGLVGGEEYELTGLQLGVNTITLANGDVIRITVSLVSRSSDIAGVGTYYLRVSIDNANYEIANHSDMVAVNIVHREVTVEWDKISFKYDGEKHVPVATVKIGNEQFELNLAGLAPGQPSTHKITLANGDVIYVVVSLVGNSDMKTGNYTLLVTIDNVNYKLVGTNSERVDIKITGYKAPVKFALSTWEIIAIAGAILVLLGLVVLLIVTRKKTAVVVESAVGDDDGFNDPYDGPLPDDE